MLYDKQNEFSDAQTVTATALGTNVIDLIPTNTLAGPVNALVNQGGHGAMFLVILCNETVTAAGAATVQFSLESDSDAALSTSPTIHYQSGAIPKTALIAGQAVAIVPLPFGDYEKYLGVRYTVGTGPLTAGKFDAFLTREVQFNRYFQIGAAPNI